MLLLLLKQGGNGLNLTEAQHVVLVEPLLSPALEVHVIDLYFESKIFTRSRDPRAASSEPCPGGAIITFNPGPSTLTQIT